MEQSCAQKVSPICNLGEAAQQNLLTLAQAGREVLLSDRTWYRYSYAVQDMCTAERPQNDAYMPVAVLYRRRRLSGFTLKN